MKISGGTLRLLIKIVVSAGLLIFLLKRISIGEIFAVVRGLDVRILAVGVFVFFFSNLLGSLQWHLLLKSSGVALSFFRTFRFYFVGLFFNNFLPANIGGDAVKVYDVTRVGSSVYQVVAVTFLDRLIGIFSLCLLASLAVFALSRASLLESAWLYFVIFGGCMALPAVFYFVEPIQRSLRWIVGRLRPMSLDRRMASVLDFMSKFKSKRLFVLKLVLLSCVIQSLRVLTHILVAVSLGVVVDVETFGLFFVFVPVLSLAMIPPITINGLGVREALGIILFSQAGIGRTDAFTLEFLTYLVSVLVSLLGCLFFLARREEATRPSADAPSI